MDEDGSGELDWNEFKNYKSVRTDKQFDVETIIQDLVKDVEKE